MTAVKSDKQGPSGIVAIFRSFQYRNYRLFFGGQSISLIGTWIQRIATPWLVYHLTGSALLLGVIGFAGQIPTFITTPFGSLLAGSLAKITGVSITILTGGIFCILGAVVFAYKLPGLSKIINSIYSKQRLSMTETISEIQATT